VPLGTLLPGEFGPESVAIGGSGAATPKFNIVLSSVVGATYTANSWDLFVNDNYGASLALTLPASPSVGDQVGLVTGISSPGTVSPVNATYAPNTGQNIYGNTVSQGVASGSPNFGGPLPIVFEFLGSTAYGSATWVPIHYSGADLPLVITPLPHVAAASNGGIITNIAAWANPSPGVLALNRNAVPPGFITTGGKAYVVTSAGLAQIGYTGQDNINHFLTGCTYISGSGTVATGAIVSGGSQAGTGMTLYGALGLYGSLYTTILALQNANYNFQPTDFGYKHSTGTHTWNLLGDEAGKTVVIVSVGGSLTLTDNAGGTINGVTSYPVPIGSSLMLQFNGSLWQTLAGGGATDTSGFATATTPTLGAAAQVNTFNDTMVYVQVTTAGQLTIAIGPTSSPANSVVTATSAAAGNMYTLRLPKGWFIAVTTSSTAVWSATAITT
jgi:hypothetical protein